MFRELSQRLTQKLDIDTYVMLKNRMSHLNIRWNKRIVRQNSPYNTAGDTCAKGDIVAVKFDNEGWNLCEVVSTGVKANATAIYADVIKLRVVPQKNERVWQVTHIDNIKPAMDIRAYALGDVVTLQGVCASGGAIERVLPLSDLKQIFAAHEAEPCKDPTLSKTVTMNGCSKAMVVGINADTETGEFSLLACTTGGRIITVDQSVEVGENLGNFYDRPFDHIGFTRFFEPYGGYFKALDKLNSTPAVHEP